ncbi:hypothetical protein [Lysobacter sp. GCM10012299]|uniref:hypothetical protein n=1 Tax=Lysobacter sp. GCM10012299 TaxID=3317333 RepID=UPI003619C4C7
MKEHQLPLPLRISLQRAMLTALIRTHPDPRKLRDEWDEIAAEFLLDVRYEIEGLMLFGEPESRAEAFKAVANFTEELRIVISSAIVKRDAELMNTTPLSARSRGD